MPQNMTKNGENGTFVFCGSGGRFDRAAQSATDMGRSPLSNMAGAMNNAGCDLV